MIEAILNLLDNYGRISAVIVISVTLWGIVLWSRGIVPVTIRAGKMRQRTVAIFGSDENYDEIAACLGETKLFKRKNFIQIKNKGNLAASLGKEIFVVSWADWGDNIEKILDRKTSETGVIIYAAPEAIPGEMMGSLQEYNFVTVTNFKGRLINDLVTMAITIRYAKKK